MEISVYLDGNIKFHRAINQGLIQPLTGPDKTFRILLEYENKYLNERSSVNLKIQATILKRT